MFLDRVERCVDELRIVAHQTNLERGRQRLPQLRHARLDCGGERHRVHAALLAHGDGDGRLAVQHGYGRRVCARVAHFAEIADADGRTRPRRHHDVGELLRRRTRPRVRTERSRVPWSMRPPGSSRFWDRSALAMSVVVSAYAFSRSGSICTCSSRRRAAEEHDLADTADRFQPLLHVLFDVAGQLDDRHGRRDREQDDGVESGILLLDHRRISRFGQVAQHRIDLRAHLLGSHVGVLREVERDRHARLALGRARAELVDARHGVDRGLDAIGDLGLDAFRRGATVDGVYRHHRDVDARVPVDAEREEGDAADYRQRGDQHRREDGAANAEFGELLHEGNLASGYGVAGAAPGAATVTGAVS